MPHRVRLIEFSGRLLLGRHNVSRSLETYDSVGLSFCRAIGKLIQGLKINIEDVIPEIEPTLFRKVLQKFVENDRCLLDIVFH